MYTVPKIFPHETQEMQQYLWCFSPMYFTHHYPRYNCTVQYSMNRCIHSIAMTSSKIPCWCSVDILNTLYLTSAGYNWVKLRHIWHTRAGEHFVRIPHPLALSLPTTRVGNEFVSKRTFHYSNVSSVSRKWDNAE